MAMMATAGIFAQKSVSIYTLDLQKDLFTGKMDTVNLSSIKLDYLGSLEDPKVQKYAMENYSYNKDHARFEQTSRFETFGTPAGSGSNLFYSDSVQYSLPAKNGSLGWQLYFKSYATKDLQGRVESNKSYTDFSYFDYAPIYNIPKGFILTSHDQFFYAGNKQTTLSKQIASGFSQNGVEYVSDSTIRISDKQNRDSLLFEYETEGSESPLYLSAKTVTTHVDNRNWIETRTTYSPDGEISDQTKTEHSFNNNSLVEIIKTFNYENDWILSSIDSTFYESDSISNVTKTYELSVFTDEFELSRISYTSKSLNFLKGNPIPVAPSNFTVWSLLSSARTDGTQETHPGYELKWEDNSYNETGFEIYRREVGIVNTQPTLIHTTTSNIETYTDHDVVKGVVYEYFIIAKGKEASEGAQIQNKSLPVSARSDGASDTKDQMFAAVAVSPNPIENGVISMSGLQGEATYEIFTVEGQQIAQGVVRGHEPIAASELHSGLYLMKIEIKGATKVYKFEKK